MRQLIKSMISPIARKYREISNMAGFRQYIRRFGKYAYTDGKCESKEQYEASIIRLYHIIEKGLCYQNYRPGFGEKSIDLLIETLQKYALEYDIEDHCYQTALCCLNEYTKKNRAYNYFDDEREKKIKALPGEPNHAGGTINVKKTEYKQSDYKEFVLSRHSIRDFSEEPVDLNKLLNALQIAQHTPSACNRQCWRTRIVVNRETLDQVLENQNGNRGFGDKIDKLIVISADLRSQQKNREFFQAFIDGGMYAANLLNALHYEGIGTIPLSAALTTKQEAATRSILHMEEAEVFILMIGVGNYPEEGTLTTRSERKPIINNIIV